MPTAYHPRVIVTILAFAALSGLWFGAWRLGQWSVVDARPDFGEPPATTNEPQYQTLEDGAVIFANGEAVLVEREKLAAAGEDFVFADLAAMEIVVWREGAPAKAFPIKARGEEGSFFETPNGVYKIRSREENHFSSIGEVWMPWSMHFYGNYFIHGWPYYPSGAPVADTYSGGCIRLSTADSEELFRETKNGMPVLVYAGHATPADAGAYFRRVGTDGRPAPAPAISAPSVLAVDFETGRVLFEREREAVRPIASVTKLMTALVAIESINRFKEIRIPANALDYPGHVQGIEAGEIFRSQDLLYPLLLESSNDVAELYPRHGWRFVDTMNQKAAAIGMHRTTFADASGIGAQNVSTAEDIFKLLRFLSQHKKPIFDIAALREKSITSVNGERYTWINGNWRDDERFLGGKAGQSSAAGQTLAGVFRVRLSEGGTRSVAIIVLGSQDRTRDVEHVIDYLEENYVYGTVFAGDEPAAAPVRTGAAIYQSIGNGENIIEEQPAD